MATLPKIIERKFSCIATAACQCFENQASLSAREDSFLHKTIDTPQSWCSDAIH